MAKKKTFYAPAIVSGAASIGIKLTDNDFSFIGEEDKALTMQNLRANLPASFDAARVSSIVVPAGIHAIVDFYDGRRFNVYSADRPTKVKPSMLAPAHVWRERTDTTTQLFSVKILTDKTDYADSSADSYKLAKELGKEIVVNMAVRLY